MVVRYLILVCIIAGLTSPGFAVNLGTEPDSLFECSIDAMRAADYEKANDHIEDALDIFINRNDSAGMARAYGYFSSSYRLMEDYEQASHYGQKSSELAKNLDDPTLGIRANNNLGIMERVRGNYESALEYYQRAEEGTKEAGDYDFQASITMNIGIVNRNLDNYELAAEAYREGLAIAREHNLTSRKQSAYNNLAGLYLHTGNYREALNLYRQSLELMDETGNRHSKPNAYNNIGYCYRNLGEYDKALSYYGEGLQLAQELGLTTDQVNIQNNLAQVYLQLDKFDRAFRYFQANTELLDEISSVSVQNSVLSNMGRGYLYLGQYDEALSYFHRARSSADDLSMNVRASRYLDLASAHKSTNAPDSSIHYSESALHYAQESGSLLDIVTAKQQLALAFAQTDDIDKSLHYIDQMAHYADAYDLPQLTMDYGTTVIETLPPSDPLYFEAAQMYMEAVEDQRRHIQVSADLRSSFFKEHAPNYKQIAEAYLDQGETEKAFRIIERTRARVLLEEIELANREESVADGNLLELQGLQGRITNLYEELETEATDAGRDSLQQRIDELKTQTETLRASVIGDEAPQYSISAMEVDELSDYIDPETAVLSFTETGNSILAFAFLDGDYQTWKVDTTHSEDFDHILERFRNAIVEEMPVPVVNHLGWRLADQLLVPAEDLIQSAEHIVISADGNLATLPYEALIWNGNYLINKHTVSTVPSLTTLKLREVQAPEDYSKDLFTLANPDFQPQEIDDALALRGTPARSPTRLDPLPATQIEAEQIGELFSNTTLISRAEANKPNVVTTDFKEYRFAHFATHGFIHREFPDLSGLALSHGDGDVEYLRSREISSLNIPSEMVVLSACETAVGPNITGEGILGLQRAFLIAGSQSVVASLWRVYDQSTARLMTRFYKAILEADQQDAGLFSFMHTAENDTGNTRRKAEAMRTAKISMINSKEYYHPVHWAAFTITGF